MTGPLPKSYIESRIISYRTFYSKNVSFTAKCLFEPQKDTCVFGFCVYENVSHHLSKKVKLWLLDQLTTQVNDQQTNIMFVKRPPSHVIISNGDFTAEMYNPEYDCNWYKERRLRACCAYSIEGEIHLYHVIPTIKQQMMRECGVA
jgi:hypothetical protein